MSHETDAFAGGSLSREILISLGKLRQGSNRLLDGDGASLFTEYPRPPRPGANGLVQAPQTDSPCAVWQVAKVWVASPVADDADNAWVVDFSRGAVNNNNHRDNDNRVRLVRGVSR